MLMCTFASSNFKQGSDIYVEAQIENLMPQPLIVERLTWEPGPLIKVTDLNSLVDWTRSRRKGRLTPTFMAPKDVWRLLYLTQPLNPGAAPTAGEVKLGHLDIAWRTTMGETGHLLTFPWETSAVDFLAHLALNLPPQNLYTGGSAAELRRPAHVFSLHPLLKPLTPLNAVSRSLRKSHLFGVNA
ncbi:unnamed protein product [Taenia asiatica]|uniref:A2M domain-containing protein n=1 Tax=Taenia asiatica TaxID=60517 RepID=A0A0R3VVQ2_TAEAS|nr:unnamed protein product [Taenia asiatica]